MISAAHGRRRREDPRIAEIHAVGRVGELGPLYVPGCTATTTVAEVSAAGPWLVTVTL
jgi:hypothetical protein